jgi:hypothetical protein
MPKHDAIYEGRLPAAMVSRVTGVKHPNDESIRQSVITKLLKMAGRRGLNIKLP